MPRLHHDTCSPDTHYIHLYIHLYPDTSCSSGYMHISWCKRGFIHVVVILSLTIDVDKSSRCRVSPEVLSTMTSQPRCHDNCQEATWRRRAAIHGGDMRPDTPDRSPAVSRRRYPIITCPATDQRRDDDRSTGTGSSCSERHVTPGDDDVTRQTEMIVGGITAIHRRRRRTAFTNDQVKRANMLLTLFYLYIDNYNIWIVNTRNIILPPVGSS